MNIVLGILSILVYAGFVIFTLKNRVKLVGIFGITLGILLTIGYYYKEIKPIDVYRGNTTLEITYKDGVAVDSVVVWKNK